MTFEEILDQAMAMLQRRGRLTYGTLKRQFQLDDAALEDLTAELIEGQRLAVDEDGRAQRAVRASLGMLTALQVLNTRLEQDQGIRLAVRLGIHTGLVVVGAMGGVGRQEQLALGETPNIAARLQGLAAPDTVVISEATAQLIQGYFVCQALGAQVLKGLAQPLMVHRVLHESEAQTRLDVAATRGLTLLVGREQE